MTQEQNMLLDVIGSALTGGEVTPPDSTCDWQKLVQEAKQQAVGLMFLDAISGIQDKLPENAYLEASRVGMAITGSNIRVGYAQAELVSRLEANGYPYLILKGESAAAYYPNPQLRTLGDVDFLIDPAQKPQITAVLQQMGYAALPVGNDHHDTFRKNGVLLEMHFQIPGIPNGLQGQHVKEYLLPMQQDARILDIGSGPFRAASEPYHGLILLLHMQGHMVGEGLGLRHLCDWACFVDKTWQMDFWQASLLPLLKRIGLMTYASVMTKTAAMYLGTACPEWAQAEEDICREVMEDIMTGGNFGRKDAARSASAIMVSNHGKDGTKRGKIYYLCSVLHDSTLDLYPNLKNKPLLVPFVMFWRACKYLWKVVKGERYALHKLAPKADERKSVYERLHIFEV